MSERTSPALALSAAIFVSLTIIPSQTEAMVWPDYQREICRKHNCAGKTYDRKTEPKLIEESGGLAKRTGDTLEFQLLNGKSATLTDIALEKSDAGSCVTHYYVTYDDRIGYFVVFNGYYEEFDFTIINRKNGSMHTIQEFPNVSPDRKRICTVSTWDSFRDNELQILAVTEQGIAKEFSYKPTEYWGSADVRWIDPRTIEVTKEVAADPEASERVYVLKKCLLVLTDYGWKMTE